jgi:hypothetical protein
VIRHTRYHYDEFALTDRGTVLQQAAGYGPSNNTRANLTTVEQYLADEDRFVQTKRYFDTVGNVVETRDA